MANSVFRAWILPVGGILLLGVAGAWAISARHGGVLDEEWQGGEEEVVAPAPPPPPPEAPFSLLFGGEFEGRLWVPPCSEFKQGGLDKIANIVHRMASKAGASIVLDTGDIAGAPGVAGGVEMETSLTVMRDLGLAVTAVGEKDLMLGLDRWREVRARAGEGIAFLCANLRDGEGAPIVPAVAHFTLGTRKVLVSAVLSPSFEEELRDAGLPVRLLPAAESVREAVAAAGKADLVVLLSHAPIEESRELARALPEVRLVISAHAGTHPGPEPEIIDGRILMSPGKGWQFVSGALFIGRPGGGVDSLDTHLRSVGAAIRPDEPVQMLTEEARTVLRTRGFLSGALAEAAAARGGTARYTGPAACATCHPAAHEKWAGKEDPHSESVRKLRKIRFDLVPNCLSCHATAVGWAGGHLKAGDEQAAVTCEACHGPGAAHTEADGRVPLADARESCVRCHIPEMDPTFNPEDAWPRILHGR